MASIGLGILDRQFNDEQTSVTLLEALARSGDEESWNRFVVIYEPMLHRRLRVRELTGHLIPDVVGDVYLKLVGQIPDFVYHMFKSLRIWLRTVFENAAFDVSFILPHCADTEAWRGSEWDRICEMILETSQVVSLNFERNAP